MKIELPNHTLRKYINGSDKLRRYLSTLKVGRKSPGRSWLYENVKDIWRKFDQWQNILQLGLSGNRFEKEFLEFESEFIDKLGPQGEIPPVDSSECMKLVTDVFFPSEYDSELALENLFKYSYEFAKFLFGRDLGSVRPMSFSSVIESMILRDTIVSSSGFPDMTKRKLNIRKEIEYARSGDWKRFPAIALFRNYRGKLRLVWIYPMSRNLIEMRFQRVIQDRISASSNKFVSNWVVPWVGFEHVKEVLTKQWLSNQYVTGGDTTAMDSHMRQSQIRLVFEIVKWLFDKSYWDELYTAIMQVNTIPMLIKETSIVTGYHGLASGSAWTQLTETILVMFIWWMEKEFDGQGIGDDFIVLSHQYISKAKVVDILAKYGLPAKEIKQTASSEYTKFLRRYFHRGFMSRESNKILGSYYSTMWALNTLIFPEKWFSEGFSWETFVIRCISILENTVDDPVFPEFVKFVAKGNRNILRFASLSNADVKSAEQQARLVNGLLPSYNQEKKDKPLISYETMRVLRSL